MVKRAFPDYFKNTRRTSPPPVDSGGGAIGGSGKYSVNRLTAEQKLAYNQFVTIHKTMSHDDYFTQLEEAGYLER